MADLKPLKWIILMCTGVLACEFFFSFNVLNIPVIRTMINHIRCKNESAVQCDINHAWEEPRVKSGLVYKGGRLLTLDKLQYITPLNVEHCRNQLFLVYKCVFSSSCGGWADRQKGIVSSFLLALLTKRTFVVDMTSPCDLNKVLLPNIYNWSICTEYLKTVSQKNIIEFNYMIGNTKAFLHQIKSFTFDKNWTKKVVVLRFNAYAIDEIRQHKKSETQLKWLTNITNEEAIHLVLHTLFKPNQRLLKDAVHYYDSRVQGKHLVCSHIRMGKNPSIPADVPCARKPNETVIFEFLERYDDRKHVIYIASDSENTKRHAETRFKSSYIGMNRTIVHVDRLGKLKPLTKETCEGLYTAILEQLILTLCDTLILTRSGFGTVAAYIRGTSANLFLFHPKTERILESNLTNLQAVFKFL